MLQNIIKSSPIYIAVIIYLIIAITIYFIKPAFLFDEEGLPIEFGVNSQQTVITYPVLLILLGIGIYVIALITTNLFNR